MQSLYGRLFTYRGRPDRSPLEDFLTEAFADLLNRLPEAIARRLVTRLLSEAPASGDALHKAWPAGSSARWSTQRAIEGGQILDLLLEIDGQPTLVIENKIAAGFQKHLIGGENGFRSAQHQLATYGKWIHGKSASCWGGAVVLLTHWTPAPADFTSGKSYGARYRSTARWSDLARWVDELSRAGEAKGSLWLPFADELVQFLREQKMDTELATSRDWAALQLYVASADRVRNSIERIWEDAKDFWRPLCTQTQHVIQVSTEYGCIWKFRYLARQDLRETYLAVGVRFDTNSAYLSALSGRSEAPNFFVEVSSDATEPAFQALTVPAGWLSSPGLWLVEKPLCELATGADRFIAEASAWAQNRIEEVVSALATGSNSAAPAADAAPGTATGSSQTPPLSQSGV